MNNRKRKESANKSNRKRREREKERKRYESQSALRAIKRKTYARASHEDNVWAENRREKRAG